MPTRTAAVTPRLSISRAILREAIESDGQTSGVDETLSLAAGGGGSGRSSASVNPPAAAAPKPAEARGGDQSP